MRQPARQLPRRRQGKLGSSGPALAASYSDTVPMCRQPKALRCLLTALEKQQDAAIARSIALLRAPTMQPLPRAAVDSQERPVVPTGALRDSVPPPDGRERTGRSARPADNRRAFLGARRLVPTRDGARSRPPGSPTALRFLSAGSGRPHRPTRDRPSWPGPPTITFSPKSPEPSGLRV